MHIHKLITIFNQENQVLTNQAKNDQKITNLVTWAKENGVIFNNIQIPTAFGHTGLRGVKATQDILPNQSIIAVPEKLIISSIKVKKSEIKNIIEENPLLFHNEKNSDYEFNMLAIYLLYEKLKGKNSFFYHYIESIGEQCTLLDWSMKDIHKIESQEIIQEFHALNSEMEKLWFKFKKVLLKHPQQFPQKSIIQLRNDFYWAYEAVMTRCFGWSLPSTSLVPFADMLNHSNEATTYFLVNKKFEKNPELIQTNEQTKQYKLKKSKIDLTLFEDDQLIENEKMQKIHEIKDKKSDFVKKHNDCIESQSSLKDQIARINFKHFEQKQKKIWELEYISSSDSEDNDTDEEEKEKNRKQFDDVLKKELEKTKKSKCEEYLRQQQEKLDKENNDEDSSSESDETGFDWYDYDAPNYFTITSTNFIPKNNQIHICYGRRTNQFLLLWYGFTFFTNKYTSVNFKLWLNLVPMPFNERLFQRIIIQKNISKEDWKKGFITNKENIPLDQPLSYPQVQIKNDKDFITYLRIFLVIYYNGPQNDKLLLTMPSNIDFELLVFSFMLKLYDYLLHQFTTTVDDDLDTLVDIQSSMKTKFATIYNLEQKIIIKEQIKKTLLGIQILKAMKSKIPLQKILEPNGGKFEILNIPLEEDQDPIIGTITMLDGMKEWLRQLDLNF